MLSVIPVSHQNCPIFPRVYTIAVLHIILPLSNVFLTAIVESERTVAMSLVVLKVPFVRVSVLILDTGTRTSPFIVFPWTLVSSISPCVSTVTLLLIVFPITIVYSNLALAFFIRHFTLTLSLAVFPPAFIRVSIRVCEHTFARLFAINPVTFVRTPFISPSQFASIMKLVILEKPIIYATIMESV
jgi:hypothetical protein